MSEPVLDLAALPLDYAGFRRLATDPRLDLNEKIGFPPAYREGFEATIFADILGKLPRLQEDRDLQVVDIGPGCAGLPRLLIDLCRQRGHTLLLIDSPEMLAHLPDEPGVVLKCAGLFPSNADEAMRLMGASADAILCYSVLHYIYIDSNLFDFIDATVAMLAPGGRALVGDIPNHSKRRRFFATERGQDFHRAFAGSDQPYVLPYDTPARGKIDDAVLAGLMQRAQAAGCDAYLMPQASALPMANRRDDLLLIRP